jgi:hypothetical protein
MKRFLLWAESVGTVLKSKNPKQLSGESLWTVSRFWPKGVKRQNMWVILIHFLLISTEYKTF